MRAQVSLTPAESKKFIAKSVVNMDVVKQANTPKCEDCGAAICDFPVKAKPWVRPV